MTKFLNISTDRTLGGSTPSDSTVSSQKAIKNYIADNVPLNKATGSDSVSLFGIGSTSDYDLNIGYGSSSGGEAVALGYSATARSVSVAIGSRSGNTGNKTNYVAIGYYAIVDESHTVAIGYASKAYAQYSIAIGDTSYAQQYATYGVAIGYNSNCTGSNSVALGYNTIADAYGTALGAGANVSGVGAIQLGYGTNSEHQSLYVGFNAATSQYRVNYKLLGSTGIIPIERLGGDSTSTNDKYLKENGTWATVSGGSNYTPNLFDYKWSDYEIADQSWIKADSFSWQDGTVYSDAYNHLVADYQGGTSQTETVGSYTISYVLATDGHKITTDGTTVANIYNESGVAWFYVLDTTNTRFKLPRKRSMQIVESVFDDTINSWYRLYSDGWVEQGGWDNGTLDNSANLTLLKEMADTSYTILMSPTNRFYNGTSPGSDNNWLAFPFISKSTTQFQVKLWDSDSGAGRGYWPFYWMVKGKSAIDVSEYQADEKYMYFYVGEFSQSATEQTAGITTAQLNAKVDLDLDNMTPSATAKETIVGWGIPDYTAGVAISTGYVAVSNGMVKIVRGGGSWGVSLRVDGVVVDGNYSNTTNEGGCLIAFVKKGSIVTWDTGNISDTPTFFPCVGG